MSPPGEWQTRFDPHFSSRGVFYLDNKRMVDVEVMEDTKYPLSVFIDHDLEAQVKYSVVLYSLITVPKIHLPLHTIWKDTYIPTITSIYFQHRFFIHHFPCR